MLAHKGMCVLPHNHVTSLNAIPKVYIKAVAIDTGTVRGVCFAIRTDVGIFLAIRQCVIIFLSELDM